MCDGSVQGFKDRSICICPRMLTHSGLESVRFAIDAHAEGLWEHPRIEADLGMFDPKRPLEFIGGRLDLSWM